MATPKKKHRSKGNYTFEQIGEILNITPERVRQIINNAEKKMKLEAKRLGLMEHDFEK